MHAKVTVLGIEKFLNQESKSLADQMTLPLDFYDPELLLATIIRKYASLPALYEDPEYFYEETDYWWKIHKSEYMKIFLVMAKDYEALDNYDRYEERTIFTEDNRDTSGTSSNVSNVDSSSSASGNSSMNSENSSSTGSTTVLDGTVGVESSDTIETKVSAFNESTYQPSQKVEETSGSTTDTDSTTTVNGTESGTGSSYTNSLSSSSDNMTSTMNGQTSGNERFTGKVVESSHNRGNIGTTRTQKMLLDELKIRTKSAYGIIAERFADDMLYGLW